MIGNVADNVAAPIYSFAEICEGLFDPLEREKWFLLVFVFFDFFVGFYLHLVFGPVDRMGILSIRGLLPLLCPEERLKTIIWRKMCYLTILRVFKVKTRLKTEVKTFEDQNQDLKTKTKF